MQFVLDCFNYFIQKLRIKCRTTLEIPDTLIKEAMIATQIKTKNKVVKLALEELIKKSKISELKQFQGKIDLDIDLDVLRNRG